MKIVLRLISVVILLAGVAFGCTFKFDPVAVPHYYRSEGWFVPGSERRSASPSVQWNGIPPVGDVPGSEVYVVRHDQPYVVNFPAQMFRFNGKRQQMQPIMARADVARIEMHGRVVAYSFGLVPVEAHMEGGKWVIDAAAACIFYATFIDDKGDGVFRLLVPAPFTAEVVPHWARKAKG